MNTRKTYTVFGEIKIVSFKKFIGMIRCKFYGDEDRINEVNFVTRVGDYASSIELSATKPFMAAPTEMTPSLERRSAYFISDDVVESCRIGMTYQLSRQQKFYKPLEELVDDAVHNYMDRYGSNNSYLVNMGNRLWMVAHPRDFSVVVHRGKYAICCMDSWKNVVYKVERFTQKEIDRLYNQLKRGMTIDEITAEDDRKDNKTSN